MIGNVRSNIWSLLLLQIFGLGDLFQLNLACVKAYSIWLQIFGLGQFWFALTLSQGTYMVYNV